MIEKFNLGAVEWTVEMNNEVNDLREVYGHCDYHISKITLQNASNGKNRTDLAEEQTLYHEVVHAILDSMSKNELSEDEEFVQQFSLLLHQFEKTKR